MSLPADPHPAGPHPTGPDPRLLDYLAGELPAEAVPAFEAALASDPELGRAHSAWTALAAAEAEAFQPAAGRAALESDAPRMAAWVRDTVRQEEATLAARRAAAPNRRVGLGRDTPLRTRGWSRILAVSVGAHLVALGVLAMVLHGHEAGDTRSDVAHVGWLDPADIEDEARDYQDSIADLQWRRVVNDDLGAQLDEVALMEQDRLLDEIDRFDVDSPTGWGAPEYPHAVTVPMLRRKNADLKRRRLDLLGFNSQGTLTAVARGLTVLAHRQDPASGMFHAAGAKASLPSTALATLVFLGEGHASHGPAEPGRTEYDRVVRHAVTALRRQVASPAAVAALPDVDIGTVAVTLCEDYMLSYGSLTPNASATRAREIGLLADAVRTRLHRAPRAGKDRNWLVWALDAARRTGVVRSTPEDRKQFDGWVASTADPAAGDASNAQAALSVGLALLYAERGSEKPRFKTWSRANAERLLARLKPTGEARTGDEVGETAMILLALQVSYRAY